MNRFLGITGFKCDKCAGRISNDSTSENVSAKITTNEIARVNSAVPPPTNIQGAKKIIVVSTANTTGIITIFAPLIAASTPVSPSSTLECIASPTMIASSTITPITNKKAKLEIMLKETPSTGRKASPPAKATAIPIETHRAITGRKNNISTTTTNNRPVIKFEEIVPIRPAKASD